MKAFFFTLVFAVLLPCSSWAATAEGTVARIVDGDTIDVTYLDQFRFRQTCRVRLYNVFTPESGEEGFFEAGLVLMTLIPPGTEIIIDSGSNVDKDRQRLLAHIYVRPEKGTQGPPVSINQQMRTLGWTQYGRGAHRDE